MSYYQNQVDVTRDEMNVALRILITNHANVSADIFIDKLEDYIDARLDQALANHVHDYEHRPEL